jgi:hypothetical protein
VRGEVIFELRAREDIRSIGDSSVAAEIYHICGHEIQVLADESPIDGYIDGSPDGDMWRRAIPRSSLDQFTRFDLEDADEFRCQACDYVVIYRETTENDKIRLKRKATALLVRAVLHNRAFAAYCLSLRTKSAIS